MSEVLSNDQIAALIEAAKGGQVPTATETTTRRPKRVRDVDFTRPTKFTAEQYADCPREVMPLGYDWNGMNAKINSMQPAGMTNQNIGLAHGWLSLTGGGPYPAPPEEEPGYKYSKVIILMSDGLNTQNRWYSNAAQIDARQKMTCDNVKAAGITLYTVHVNTGGDPMSTLLQQCASSSDKFFHLTTASAMVATFQQIGSNLSNLRIAQ